MATTLTINNTLTRRSVTKSSVKIYVSFTVTYDASYYVLFEVYDSRNRLVDSAQGNTYHLPAGGSKGENDDFYKTFSGLSPGEDYIAYAYLYNATKGTDLGVSDSVTFTTEADLVTFYGKVVLDGNGGTYNNGITTCTFNGRVADQDASLTSCRIPIGYSNPGFIKKGYTLLWFQDKNEKTYPLEGTYNLISTSKSKSDPTKVVLRAIWEEEKSKIIAYNAEVDTDQENKVTVGMKVRIGVAGKYSLLFAIYKDGTQIDSYNTTYTSYSYGQEVHQNHAFEGLNFNTTYDYYVAILKQENVTHDSKKGTIKTGVWQWSGKVKFTDPGATKPTLHDCPVTSGGSVPIVKKSDGTYKMYFMNATEWNLFCDQVNALRKYHGLNAWTFTAVKADTTMYADTINQAIHAMNEIERTKTIPVSDGDPIGATVFIDLQNEFNRLYDKKRLRGE